MSEIEVQNDESYEIGSIPPGAIPPEMSGETVQISVPSLTELAPVVGQLVFVPEGDTFVPAILVGGEDDNDKVFVFKGEVRVIERSTWRHAIELPGGSV
jgi:hypothetical protein